MKNELIAGGVGTGLGVLGTAMQLNEVLQTISLIITILGALVSFVVVPLLSWHRNAKKDDGKISEEELKEGCKHLMEGVRRTREFLEQSAAVNDSQTTDEDKREEIKKKGGTN